MGIGDTLLVIGVFVGFGVIILSKIKEKNPKRHEAIVGMFKGLKEKKDKIIKPKQEAASRVILAEDTRIM